MIINQLEFAAQKNLPDSDPLALNRRTTPVLAIIYNVMALTCASQKLSDTESKPLRPGRVPLRVGITCSHEVRKISGRMLVWTMIYLVGVGE